MFSEDDFGQNQVLSKAMKTPEADELLTLLGLQLADLTHDRPFHRSQHHLASEAGARSNEVCDQRRGCRLQITLDSLYFLSISLESP